MHKYLHETQQQMRDARDARQPNDDSGTGDNQRGHGGGRTSQLYQ